MRAPFGPRERPGPTRRRLLALGARLAGVAGLALGTVAARGADPADGYPAQPVKILVGFAAGGAPDALARIVGEQLRQRWSQPVTVENRTGAQGNIAMSAAAKAEPDGTTLVLVPVGNASVNPSLFRDLPYDMGRDFAPISMVATAENVLVVDAKSPIRSLADLVARGRGGQVGITYATPGAGSLAHLAAELLTRSSGFEARHVPYRGVSPALTDVMRGEVTMTFAQLSTAKPFIEGGQLRALGVASAQRSPLLPEVPTVAEAAGIPGFEALSWYGLMAPARTPPAILAKLNAALVALLGAPDVQAALAAQGMKAAGGTPEAFTATIRQDTERWAKIIRDAGIKVE